MLESHTLKNQWSLGVPFFRNYYTVFDAENAKVGLSLMNGTTNVVYMGTPQPTLSDVYTFTGGGDSGAVTVEFWTGVFTLVKVGAFLGVISGSFAGLIFLLQYLSTLSLMSPTLDNLI